MKITQFLFPFVMVGSVSASVVAPPPPDAMMDIMGSTETKEDSYSMGVANSLDQFQVVSTDTAPPTSYVAPPPPEEFDSSWNSSLEAGYASNYSYKGMVVGNSYNKAGALSLQAATSYTLDNGTFLAAEVNYTEIFEGYLKDHGQTCFSLAVGDEFFPNLKTTLGYGLVHGGIAGEYAKFRGESHSLTQEIFFSALYGEETTEGFFYGLDGAYSFQGITGWWLGATIGYNYELTDKLKAVVTTTASASWSYWEADGANSVNCTLQLPYAIQEEWIVSPFASVNWTGRSGLKTNSQMEEHVFRPFTFMVGVEMKYTF